MLIQKKIVAANFSGTYKVIVIRQSMLLPAEIESKTLIPALRAILAKNLAENHNVREDEISKMLGVTQAAISNYIRGTRGDPELIKKLSAEKQVSEMINEIAIDLSSDMAYSPSSLSNSLVFVIISRPVS